VFDRPALSDSSIAEAIRTAYGTPVRSVAYLGLGHDQNGWTFRADLESDEALFLKVRHRTDAARLAACRFLFESGIEAIVAPRATMSGELSTQVEHMRVIAYPFVDARPAVEVGLTDEQWIAYGALVGGIHGTPLPGEIESALPHETFRPSTIAGILQVDSRLEGAYPEFVAFWREHRRDIQTIVERTGALAAVLQATLATDGATDFVPCHGDIHTHNVLVDAIGVLRVVDWDEMLMAPRERDLMFLLGSPIGLPRGQHETALLNAGYGPIDVNPDRLAYYHAEWAVQDIAAYADETLSEVAGPESRAAAFAIFRSIFDPDGEAQVALSMTGG
jgi:spectinomycin phosphotransferase